MLSHYLKTAFRNLLKFKSVSLINTFGLAIGLCCCLLILIFILHELSYDTFHKQSDRIFRTTYTIDTEDFKKSMTVTPNIISPLLQREFPEVIEGVRVYGSAPIVRKGEQAFQERRFYYVDSSFFAVFSFPAISGNIAEGLTRPHTLILTQSTAEKYFGQEEAIGKILEVGSNNTPYEVVGIIMDVPGNSHLQFDMLASYYSLGKWAQEETYGSANYFTYFLLDRPESVRALETKIPDILKRDLGDRASAVSFAFQPLKDIHLRSTHLDDDLTGAGDISYVYLLGAIGLLILLIACINYMNLATARSIDRAKEVGLRKVVGAQRNQIFWQFLGEAIIITLFSLGIGILVARLVLPWFGDLIQRPLTFNLLFQPLTIMFIVGIGLLVAFLAGGYPAMVFARFKPITILRGSYKTSSGGIWLRRGLVIFQFVVSIVLIIGTLVVKNQLDFIQHKKIGYDKEHVVVLPVDSKISQKLPAIKNEITRSPLILNATACTESPYQIDGGYSLVEGWADGDQDGHFVRAMAIDHHFVQTMGLELAAGEDFRDHIPENWEDQSYQFLINEKTLALLNWSSDEAVGRRINLNGRKGFIKGVVKDFHVASLHQEISPLVLFSENTYRALLVRIAPGNIEQSLAHLESVWQTWAPHRPYDYTFLDQQFDRLYRSEQRTSKVFTIFALLAILIACMGLFGLASFMTVQRAKEIGIRKVLGASVSSVISLLSREYIRLVGISFLIAAPLAWYIMQTWLEGFSYKTGIGLGTMLLAGAGALLISWLTVSFQAVKAARTDPAKVLKDE